MSDDLRRLQRGLGSVTAGPLSDAIVNALADVWRDTSKRDAPVDTGQLKGRIAVTRVSGGSADVVSDVPYAGFVEFGTRYVPARPYFRRGMDAAERASAQLGPPLESELRRVCQSGGVFNPRANGWTKLRGI